jgi:hypothetical protein
MRILTVRQPWAWAIIHGGKDVENRTTNIAGSYRGPIAIHAGLAPFEQDNAASRVHSEMHGGQVDTRLVFGAIIGVVDLHDVHYATREYEPIGAGVSQITDRTCCGVWAMRDHHHLRLRAPRALRQPIPYKGALGLRELPADVANEILGSLA